MLRIPAIFLFFITLLSCHNSEKVPDVSDIKVSFSTERFEREFFDTSALKIRSRLDALNTGAGTFSNNYLIRILGVDPRLPADSNIKDIVSFIRSYQNVYDTVQQKFGDFTPYERELKKSFQFIKYYFPDYELPKKIITYIGPADGYGDALSYDGLLIGLHHHLGKDFSLYKTEMVRTYYPEYITNRCEPEYININSVKNILSDIYPENTEDKPLVLQMIDNGKRLYILHKLLPLIENSKLIGYTQKQYDDCISNEAVIWNMLVKNALLQVTDANITKNYINDVPKTQELGEGAPGNVGSFIGWQIVKKYMGKYPDLSPKQLIAMDPERIFEAAKYKP